MNDQSIKRFSPLSLRNGIKLPNRIVVPAMASETADNFGFVTDKTISHYSRLSESQAGLIFIEYSYIHSSGRSDLNQIGIDSDNKIEGISKIAKAIQKSGALAGIQLTHAGGKTERQLTNGFLQSPSGIIVPVKEKTLEQPDEMNMEDIINWKEWFLKAAKRAVKANFNFIELHSAHGYGLNQWLSPLTNKRDDFYGGNILKRTQLLLEIIHEIRSRYPQILLSVRIPGQDFLLGGLTIKDSLQIAQLLQDEGVDIINVSSGIGGWRRPQNRIGEGYLIEEAAIIQRQITIPVIGVGGLETGLYIDNLLYNKKISLAAVGRAILKNPRTWGEQQLRSFHHD